MLEDLLLMVNETGSKLWIAPFSEKLLEPYREKCPFITMDPAGLEKAEKQDYCFVETGELQEWTDAIEKIVVYHWNRVYPADTYLDLDLSQWKRVEQKEFQGSSHERITREVYGK